MDKSNPKGVDGVDFINIYSKGDTKLGRFLSNWSRTHMELSIGHFNSIEGLIFYLGSFDDSLRSLYGYEAKKKGETCDKGVRLPEDIFRRIIVEGMKSKILESEYLEEFKESTLPFVHYYEYSGRRIVPTKWLWQIEAWEQLRERYKD